MYIAQIATAIPLALYLITRAGRHRAIAILAAMLLAVPMQPLLFWSSTIGPFIGSTQRITANLDRSPIGANPIFHAKLDNPTAIDPIVAGPLRRRPCCQKCRPGSRSCW